MRMLVVLGIAVLVCARAYAEPAVDEPPARAVALLPLDADANLELYGQPVASELSRVLVGGGLEVVLVGPKMAVPAQARLVVDGTIKLSPGKSKPGKGKDDGVTISVRVRDSRDGTVYETLVVNAAALTDMDHAAEELSAKVLPSVKGRLATLIEQDKAALTHKPDVTRAVTPAPVKLAPMLAAITAPPGASAGVMAVRDALAAELAPWAARRHHEPRVLDIHALGGKAAPKTVVAEKAELSIELEVLELTVEQAQVPLATARVRVRIADPQVVFFDRVIVTDTILGDKQAAGADARATLAARVAREVLAIADPHLKRGIPTWW
jgi:hypothetical protein